MGKGLPRKGGAKKRRSSIKGKGPCSPKKHRGGAKKIGNEGKCVFAKEITRTPRSAKHVQPKEKNGGKNTPLRRFQRLRKGVARWRKLKKKKEKGGGSGEKKALNPEK